MARVKVPCKAFGTAAGCSYGDKCIFHHDHDQNPQSRPKMSALAAANKAANANVHASPNTSQAHQLKHTGPCRNFWNFGNCQLGDRCRFDHVANPDIASQVEARLEIVKSGAEAKPSDPFPSLSCLDEQYSDPLLVPFKYLPAPRVTNLLQTLKMTKSITRANQAEEVLTAILSSSHQNERWVSRQHSDDVTDSDDIDPGAPPATSHEHCQCTYSLVPTIRH